MKSPISNPRSDEVLSVDCGRLRARLRRLQADAIAAEDPRWQQLAAAIDLSKQRRAVRAASVPAVTLDDSLPISAEADRIVELIRKHPVVVIAGETGSGKTTQLPKLCLLAGRGVSGMIGCTQPRRIAARAVARRVAEELHSEVGALVGFQVRFTDQVGDAALIKFMTDGILLAETQGDAWLSRYDTLIIDEAHERSLNIDFLLGYLKGLLQRRPDLKVIVTSATIDTERFAAHFGGAPVVAVEGRTYPVEVRYRPPDLDGEDAGERGLTENLLRAVDEITAIDAQGDVLVFLPGEREIRDAHLALARRKYRSTEVLPLYARLSARDQDRVFHPDRGRRIVLATNVAETSLTVPRIRYVIDPGLARVNRYSPRLKVQRLHSEPISQASADQRKGRCGRIGPGICYRLYGEDDFQQRPRYTDPELARSALAGVILRLLSLKLGAIEDFAFLDPPNERAIADGYQQLTELGAISADRKQLTEIGRTLARLPIDSKLGRMLIEASRLHCLSELIVIAAFLSIQDPRERPSEAREAADRAHAAFADPKSDFVAVLKLWDAYRVAHEDLAQSKLRDWCSAHFLSFLRLREWRELHRQLLLLAQELGWSLNPTAAEFEPVHRAVLSGLPGHIGRKDEKGQYQGTRGRKYAAFPGSGVAKTAPAWMLSAIYLDTARLYGLVNARVEPLWVEQQAAHLIKRRHFDPHWSRKDGRVLAFEQTTLFGLVLTEKRRVSYGNLDPDDARRIFIREALLTGEIDCRADFVLTNQRTLELAREEEAKRRRHGLLKSEDELFAWLEARIGEKISTSASLDAWHKSLTVEQRGALLWGLDEVLAGDASSSNAFPTALRMFGRELKLSYRFEPNHVDDGVTLDLPLEVLNALSATRIEWLVPGLLPDKVAELIRALPKALRRNFVPAPDFARAFCAAEAADERPLLSALGAFLQRVTGVAVAADQWQADELPAHLRMNLRLIDANGVLLASGRDLAALRARFGEQARQAFAKAAAAQLAREGLTRFDFDQLPASVTTDTGLIAFPALVDTGDSAAIRVFEREDQARREHAAGVLCLLRLGIADKRRQAKRQLILSPKTAMAYTAIESPEQLRDDIVEAALLDLTATRLVDIRGKAQFEALAAEVGRQLFAASVARADRVDEIGRAYAALAPRLHPPLMGFAQANFDDLREQLNGLVYAGFAADFSAERLAEIPRYLKAMGLRVDRLQVDPRKDQQRMIEVREFVDELQALGRSGASREKSTGGGRGSHGSSDANAERLERLRWLIEEYRVQLFAQELKTREPVSEKRLRKLVEELRASW